MGYTRVGKSLVNERAKTKKKTEQIPVFCNISKRYATRNSSLSTSSDLESHQNFLRMSLSTISHEMDVYNPELILSGPYSFDSTFFCQIEYTLLGTVNSEMFLIAVNGMHWECDRYENCRTVSMTCDRWVFEFITVFFPLTSMVMSVSRHTFSASFFRSLFFKNEMKIVKTEFRFQNKHFLIHGHNQCFFVSCQKHRITSFVWFLPFFVSFFFLYF